MTSIVGAFTGPASAARSLPVRRTAAQLAALRLATLTPRQWEVLRAVMDGKDDKAIARELGISPRAVESHRTSIMRKTATTSPQALQRLHMAATAR